APLLLLAGGGLSLAAAFGRIRLAAARNRLARLRRREPQGLEAAMRARNPYRPTGPSPRRTRGRH
ncbi:MAG TPA: hypothetical protein VHQ68_15575, partial [Propionibacteriaceae bacterium]|nr:hypothetical protein [Propionibacteriaceae bacterium]